MSLDSPGLVTRRSCSMKSYGLSTKTVPSPVVVGDENPSGAPVLALLQEGLPEQPVARSGGIPRRGRYEHKRPGIPRTFGHRGSVSNTPGTRRPSPAEALERATVARESGDARARQPGGRPDHRNASVLTEGTGARTSRRLS